MAKKRTYTEKQKLEALRLLERNKGKIRQTAKEIGVSYSTLVHWKESYSMVEKADEEFQESVVEIKRNIDEIAKQQEEEFLNMSHNLAMEAYKRMMERIPYTKDLHVLAGIFKIATDAHRNLKGVNPDQNGATFNTYIQNLNNNYKKL